VKVLFHDENLGIFTMDDIVRQKLKDIIYKFGKVIVEDSVKCEGLLRDLISEYKREANLLILTLKEDIPIELLKYSNDFPKEVILSRLVNRLQDNFAISREPAMWAVESWNFAFEDIPNKKVVEEEPSTGEPPTKAPSTFKTKDSPTIYTDFFIMVNGLPYKEGKKVEIEFLDGIKNDIEIKVVNIGEVDLLVNGIQINYPFSCIEANIFPLKVIPGDNACFNFDMDFQKRSKKIIESSISINTPAINKEVKFLIEKKSVGAFEGILAVHISILHTMIAYSSEGKTGFIPLEKSLDAENATVSPSAIQYYSILAGKPEEYKIGELARSLMIFYPKSTINSIISIIKEERGVRILPIEESSGWVYFTPTEVAVHFIQRLLEKTEKHLEKKVKSLIFTHPSDFSPYQINTLKEAFEINGITEILSIGEAEAAALSHIIKGRPDRQSPYVIGVFNCGALKTDFTLLEILERRENEQRIIDVNLGYNKITRSLGGNKLTGIMMNILVEKINNGSIEFEKDYNEVEGMRFYYTPADEGNDQMHKVMIPKGIEWDRVVMHNRRWLWDLAEACKIELSNNETTAIEKTSAIDFVKKDNNLVRLNVRFHIEKREFEDRIYDKIFDFVKKIKKISKKTGKSFDLILLTGMSSQLPLIYQLFFENFGDIIQYSDDLKKCAVLGALHYYEMYLVPGNIEIRLNRKKI
jgi:hypothetical protein